MQRKLRVTRTHFQGLELLQESLRRKAGILLTCNHCRWADPLVVGVLGVSAATVSSTTSCPITCSR